MKARTLGAISIVHEPHQRISRMLCNIRRERVRERESEKRRKGGECVFVCICVRERERMRGVCV